MKRVEGLFLTLTTLVLVGCTPSKPVDDDRPLGYDKHTVSYMLNYRESKDELPSGASINSFSFLYHQDEIEIGEKLVAPTKNPERVNYSFNGWYKESECINLWDFDNEKAANSMFLYAKWGQTSVETYTEPEYVYPEKIITDADFRLIGILNIPIVEDKVSLSTGAINRLKVNKDNVKFALNYERKESVQVSTATYNEITKTISVLTSTLQSFSVQVIDKSASLSLQTINSGYETKAQKYETESATFENHHIILGGSSSMEYWTTSTEDLDPIASRNHGIAGTTVEQWTDKLLERLVLPYSPKAVAYYVGVNNIINSGDNGSTTGTKVLELLNKTHQHLPHAQVFYVLINKLPGYGHYSSDFKTCNDMVIDFAKSNSWVTTIDAGAPLLKSNGEPSAAYFRPDGLHMSIYGYTLWGNEVKKAFMKWLG